MNSQAYGQLDRGPGPKEARPLHVPVSPTQPTVFPLAISKDRRRIIDAHGQSFLIQGDAAWSLIANTTLEEATNYLDDRRDKGFNTIVVNLLEYLFAKDPPRNLAGEGPFTTPSDFRTPNERYMEHAERVLELAEGRGILVVLAPVYLGYPKPHMTGYGGRAEGWYQEVLDNGPGSCRAWGEYLGHRFGRFENVLWCIGGDRNPGDARAGLHQVAEGIRSTGARNLFTAHVLPESSPVDEFAGESWLDVNVTYSYQVVPRALQKDWQREPVWPFFLIESTYENEANATDQQIRRQAYWSVLCGGNGHCMGNTPIWLFGDGWKEALQSPASIAMARWGAFFRGLPWSQLEPDNEHRMVVSGLGEANGLDRVTAARTSDGRIGVAYLPVHRPIEVLLETLSGPSLAVEWFEPGSGRLLPGGILQAAGSALLTPPFDLDSVVLLRSQG